MPKNSKSRGRSGKTGGRGVRLRPVALPLDTRTLTVLGGLALSMILVAALLLVLEPRPAAAIGGPILTVLESGTTTDRAMSRVAGIAEPGRWDGIVIHHSGRSFGRADDIARQHQRWGFGGLGYHFVIGNGDGEADGEVLVGYRWTEQEGGRHIPASGPAANWYNDRTIGICLIGDGDRNSPTDAQMRRVSELVRALQDRLGIPAGRVYLMSDLSASTSSPGRLFPVKQFREALASVQQAG